MVLSFVTVAVAARLLFRKGHSLTDDGRFEFVQAAPPASDTALSDFRALSELFFLLHLPTSYATVAQSRLRAVPVQFQGAAHHRSEQHQSNISAVSQLFSACFGSSSSAVFEHIFIVYQWYFHRSQTIVSEQFQGSSRVISALF